MVLTGLDAAVTVNFIDNGSYNLFVANLLAFAVAVVVMFVVAWLIERLALRYLVNQEGEWLQTSPNTLF